MKSIINLPHPLKPGNLLRVVAPSGALRELEGFEKGMEIWRSRGYRLELGSYYNASYGYLAGTDTQRREDLAAAWYDSECKGILCVRGGYGSSRLLENWSWNLGKIPPQPTLGKGGSNPPMESIPPQPTLGKGGSDSPRGSIPPQPLLGKGGSDYPISQNYEASSQPPLLRGDQGGIKESMETKWLIGFSDVTGLLWSLANVGVAGVHAPVLTTLASEPVWSIERLFTFLEGGTLAPLAGNGWGGGKVTGMLLPGNLTVATSLLGTKLQPCFDGVILALEDVTEYPYRIDRMLTQWRMMGAFAGVKGIALGRFSRCEPAPGIPSFTVEEVLRDRLSDLGIPIVSDLPFGHDGVNAALPVGQLVELDGDQGLLSW